MQLIIKFNRWGRGWFAGVSTLVLALTASRAAAQLAAPTKNARPAGSLQASARARPAQLERYRNGSAWITVERQPPVDGTLQAVLLHADTRTFHAQIDRNAVVQLAPDAAPEAFWAREHLHVQRVLSVAARIYLVAADGGGDGVQLASRLAHAPEVIDAIPDLYLPRKHQSITIPPNDPRYSGQWYLKKISIERAWRLSTGNRDTTVVVIDDGCDMKHPDLEANMLDGTDLVDMDDDPSFEPATKGNAHGTQCAGLIAAQADNGIGIAGTCPECTLRCVRLLPGNSKGVAISADLQAFDYVLTVGASVASNSWGFEEAMPVPAPLRSMIEKLYSDGRDGRGTLVVFAAGNESRKLADDEIEAIPGVLTVGATNNFDEAAPFSNYGRSLGLAAPAGTLTTDISGADGDDPSDYTDEFGGTSSACPVVAGVAGLVMSAQPTLSASDVEQLLISTARSAPFADNDASGHDQTYGFGIVDPGAALRTTLGVTDPEPADAGAGKSDAGVTTPTRNADSGCSVRDPGAAAANGWLCWGALLCWVRRRARVRAG